MVQAVLGDLVFDGTRDGGTYRISRDGIKGWFDGASLRRDRIERPRAHGEFYAPGFLGGRVITLAGRIHSENNAAQERDMDRLGALLADGGTDRLLVHGEERSLWADVGRVGKPDISVVARGMLAMFQLTLWAPDPLRFADGMWAATAPPTAGQGVVWPLVWPLVWPGGGEDGRVVVANTGEAPSWPRFRLLGGFSAATVTSTATGARIGFDRPVPPGSVVEIDTHPDRRGAIIDGSSSVSRWLGFREWEQVPANGVSVFQFDVVGASGDPTLEAKVDSAWW